VACSIPSAKYPHRHLSEGHDKHVSGFMGEVSITATKTFSSSFPNYSR